jgi:hypothetical protein
MPLAEASWAIDSLTQPDGLGKVYVSLLVPDSVLIGFAPP